MKRLGAVAALTVSSLLLTSCSLVPTGLEEFFDWREKFFLTMSFSDIESLFGPILSILIVMALAVGLLALIVNMRKGDSALSGGYITSLAIFGAVAMVYLYIPMAKSVGEYFLSPDLTLDKVLAALRWALSMDFTKLFLSGAGLFITLIIPIISALWQIVMLIGAIVGVTISATSGSLKGVWYAISQVFGWALFLTLYNGLVYLIGKYYPDWNFDAVAYVVNAFYLFATLMLMGACYIGFPMTVARLAPDRIEVPEAARRRLKIPLDRLIVVPVPSDTGHKGPTTEHPETDDERSTGLPRPQLPPGSSGPGDYPDQGYGRGRRRTPPLLPPGPSDSGQTFGDESGNNGVGFDNSAYNFEPNVIELGGKTTKASDSAEFDLSLETPRNHKSASQGKGEKDETSENELPIHETADQTSTRMALPHNTSLPSHSSKSAESDLPVVETPQKRGFQPISDELPGEEIGKSPTVRTPNPSLSEDKTAGVQPNSGENNDFVLEIS